MNGMNKTQLVNDLIEILEREHDQAVAEADKAWSRVCTLQGDLDDATARYRVAMKIKGDTGDALIKSREIAGLVTP
jgi:Tfp pilus assembly protein PilF